MKSKISYFDTRAGKITFVSLSNEKGAWIVLSSLGAGIVSVNVPDGVGVIDDVVIGYDDPADYMGDGPCAGKIPGRYANRIAKGRFTLDGVEYNLPVNNASNHLHGGPDGFQNKIWEVENVTDSSVTFVHHSPDGDSGYPGNLDVKSTYTWDDNNMIMLTLEAVTDAPTVVNLTNHSYFNLSGHDASTAMCHLLKLNASRYLPTDNELIPTGEIADVAGTPMDFTKARMIGSRISDEFDALKYGKGYDNCWIVDNYEPGKMQQVAYIVDIESGRTLDIASDQPGVQVYTGNWLTGSPVGKNGTDYKDYAAVAVECQDFPDAPNRPGFPSTELRPGEKYERHISFRFGTLMTDVK
ncbi:MAG: galactose mutarotase [Muribaculaceae bacterium]|nr:galactose mutarotase [Muribaculaceae bacterium]